MDLFLRLEQTIDVVVFEPAIVPVHPYHSIVSINQFVLLIETFYLQCISSSDTFQSVQSHTIE